MILKNTNEELRLISSAASSIDYEITFADLTTDATDSTVEGTITTATTTTVVASPSINTQRVIMYVSVTNTTASTPLTVQFVKYVGASGTVLTPKFTLNGGETVLYIKGQGWTKLDSNGNTIYMTITSISTTPNSVLFNNSGAGGASGSSFNGSSALTVSYNTIGAQPLSTNLTSVAALAFVSNSFVKMSAAGTFSLDTNTYLTANQTITLSGDVTGSGSTSISTTIPSSSITFAKIQNISTSRLLGRVTAGSGVVEELTGTQATTLIDVFTSTLKGVVPGSGGGTTNFLRADGTWAAPSGIGTTTNPVTFNNSGTGASSGATFNGSSAVTISYNTIGAQPLSTNLTSLAGLSYVSSSFVKMTAAGTFSLDTNSYLAGTYTGSANHYLNGAGSFMPIDAFWFLGGNYVASYGSKHLGTRDAYALQLISNNLHSLTIDSVTANIYKMCFAPSATVGYVQFKIGSGADVVMEFDIPNRISTLSGQNAVIISSGTGDLQILTNTGMTVITVGDITFTGNITYFNGASVAAFSPINLNSVQLQFTDTAGGGSVIAFEQQTDPGLASFVYKLPLVDPGTSGGGANQMLISNSLGVMSWANIAVVSLTTTGSSGASTLTGGVLNVPNYTLAGLGGQPLSTILTTLSALASASGVLVNNGSGTLSWSTSPTLTGTNFTGIPLAGIVSISNNTLLGNNSGGSSSPSALNGTQVTAILDLFSTSSTTKGLVPGSNGVGTTYFLRADGTWAIPAGGSSGITIGSTTITGGSTGRVLYNNGGVVGEMTTTGSGTVIALSTNPIFPDSVTVGSTGSTTGTILFKGSTSGTVTLKVANTAGTWTMVLPTSAGTSGYFLQTDGSGNTSWAAGGATASVAEKLFESINYF